MIQKDKETNEQKSGLRQAGLIVFGILVVLLFLEYVLASIDVPNVIILVFAGMEAGIILWEYMHVSRFFGQEQEDRPE